MKANRFVENGVALVGRVEAEGDIKDSVACAVAAIGGFGKLVKPGDEILVTPNVNTADPPPGSSDPLIVRAVIDLLYQHGAGKVILGASSTFSQSTRQNLVKTGMLQMAEEAGAEVAVFEEDPWVRTRTGGRHLRRVSLARAAVEAEKIVYVCCLKTHFLADFTMSLKLAMGFVRRRDRLLMHARGLKEKLVDLNLAVQPDLIVMDGRRCFISGGPGTGELREPNLVLASGDQIAIDVEGIRIIQSYPGNSLEGDPWQLPMIRLAVELGLGATGDAGLQVISLGTSTNAT
jgi:uncharacterized protein (DUF362 family)